MKKLILSVTSFCLLLPTAFAAFLDAPYDHIYADAIEYVERQGIVSGYSNGTFRPDNPINRAEFMKIILGAVYLEIDEGGNCFPDVKDEWFAKYVCFGKDLNIISGYSDGTFRPAQNVSFVEAAKIIVNAFGEPVTVSDVWYEPYVTVLGNEHAIPIGIDHFEKNITRGEMAEIIFRLLEGDRSKSSQTYQSLQANRMASAAPDDDLTIGLHIGEWAVTDFDMSGIGFESDNFKDYVWWNMDWTKRQGYDIVLLDVMDVEGGTYFFKSDVLARNGYTQGKITLDTIVKEAHARGIKIYAEPTVLAWRLYPSLTEMYDIGGEPLTRSEVKQVIATLLDDYDFDGIVEETFPFDYVEAINDVVQARGKTYIHKFDDPFENEDILMSEDYVGFLSSEDHVDEVSETGAEQNSIGLFNLLFAHAKAIGKPGWVKVSGETYDLPRGAEHNVLLLRAVQFGSDGYFIMPGSEEGFPWLHSINMQMFQSNLNYFRTPFESRPIANIVVPSPNKMEVNEASQLFLTHVSAAATNALHMAGFDLRLTYGRPISDADMYVILVSGESEDGFTDLPENFLTLLDAPVPVVVFAEGLTNRGNLKHALPKLGISSDFEPEFSDYRIDSVFYKGETVDWHGFPIWDYPLITSIIDPSDIIGEIIVSDKVDGEETALIVRRDNKILVNGNVLHLDVSFIVSDLLDGILQQPFNGYGIAGQRSAFFALDATTVKARLPIPDRTWIWLIRFGSDGNLIERKRTFYHPPLDIPLRKHELLIVEVDE